MAKIFLFFIFILLSSLHLKVIAQNNYTHKLLFEFNSLDANQSKANTTTHFFSSYDKYLFEYIVEEKIESSLIVGQDKVDGKVRFDTISIQIIDVLNKKYVQIDRFSKKFILLNKGDYRNSTIGLKLKTTVDFNPLNHNIISSSDTLICNQKIKYSSDTIRKSNGSDSLINKVYFAQFDNLNTLWTLLGIPNANGNFTFLGFSSAFLDQKLTLSLQVKDIQPLGKREQEISKTICEKLILEGFL